MKRDMDLCRQILMKVEDQPAGESVQNLSEVESDDAVLAEHVWLLKQAGLVEATFPGDSPYHKIFIIHRLTPEGHDFVAQARQSVLWEKAKETAGKVGVGLTIDVMKTILSGLATAALKAIL